MISLLERDQCLITSVMSSNVLNNHEDGWKIDLQKCQLAETEIEWLGYKYTQTGTLSFEKKLQLSYSHHHHQH